MQLLSAAQSEAHSRSSVNTGWTGEATLVYPPFRLLSGKDRKEETVTY